MLKNYPRFATLRKSIAFIAIAQFSIFHLSGYSFAQCLTPPVQPSCASGVPLVDNDNLTTGITKVVTGTSSFSNLTLNGGTLIICGTLNLSAITFNSGTIYVCSGGTLNVNTGASVVFGTNSSIYNYGQIYFASSIVTGANNLIVNCSATAYFNIPFNQFVLQGPNTQFVNYGTFNSSYFIVQSNNSPAPVCSGPGSVIITGTMINQYGNAFTSPNGTSCIQITNQALNSQPMTVTANVNICYYGSSASGLNFGGASITLNCSSCSVALPVDNINLAATCNNSTLQLNWTVESETNCSDYEVQLSEDAAAYTGIRQLTCTGPSTEPINYSCAVEIPPLWHYYVRVKRVNIDGNEVFSPTLALNCLQGSTIDIFPTYVVGSEITIKSDDRIIAINMYAMDGRKVKSFDVAPDQKIVVLNIGADTSLGEYLLTVETPETRVDKLIHIAR